MATIDLYRVAAVWATRPDGNREFGSGFLIGPRLVLTAAHVLDGLREPTVKVGGQLSPGRPVWSGQDVMLVELTGTEWRSPATVLTRWGWFTTGAPAAEATAAGYPDLQYHSDLDGRELQDSQQIDGRISPGTGPSAGRYEVELAGAAPRNSAQSPWHSFSGAAVFCGDDSLLTGVIVIDNPNYRHDNLVAVRAQRLLADPDFREVVKRHCGRDPELESVEVSAAFARPTGQLTGSPANLLRPENAVVPFRGRASELARLQQWCGTGDGLSTYLLHGEGGQGKSRLARELAGRMRAEGWLAGSLSRTPLESALSRLRSLTTPTLLVVDYAETTPQLVESVTASLREAASRAPMRLLLLARSAGEWWNQVRATQLGGIGEAQALGTLESDLEGRKAGYRLAVQAFAGVLTTLDYPAGVDWAGRAAELPEPELNDERYDSALQLHMRALTDLLTAGRPDPATHAGGVEDTLLAYEQEFWRRYWQAVAGTTMHPALLRRAVVAATLYGATGEDDAAALLREVPGWADQDENTRLFAASWLHHTYPPSAGGYVGALQPDLLGEHLIAMVAPQTPQLVTEMLAGGDQSRQEHALTVLARTAVGHRPVGDLLTATVVTHRAVLAPRAITAATRAAQPEPLVTALDAALVAIMESARAGVDSVSESDLATMTAFTDGLPPLSTALSGFGARAWEAAVEIIRAAPMEPTVRAETIVPALTQLALWRSHAGLDHEAIAAAEESEQGARVLFEQDPQHVETLIVSAQVLALALRRAGRGSEATQVSGRLRSLAAELPAEQAAGYLPAALGIHAADLVFDPQSDDAEAAAVAATALDAISAALPDGALDPELASLALSDAALTQAIALTSLGQDAAALPSLASTVTTLTDAAHADPDVAVPHLAAALFVYGGTLANLERYDEGLPHLETSTRLLRELARRAPGRYQSLFADVARAYSYALRQLGHHSEAIPPMVEAVQAYRALADRTGDRTELAEALEELVDVVESLGDRPATAHWAAQAAETYETLLDTDSDRYLPRLAAVLSQQGRALAESGRLAEAVPVMEDVVNRWRSVCAQDPDQRGALAVTLALHANVLQMTGDRDQFGVVAQEAITLLRELIGTGKSELAMSLAGLLGNKSAIAAAEDRDDEALALAREATGLVRGIPDVSPTVLSEALNAEGWSLVYLNRIAEALPIASEASRLLDAIDEDESASPVYLLTYLSSLTMLAVCRAFGDDLAGTQTALRGATATHDRLLALDPQAFADQRQELLRRLDMVREAVRELDIQ